MAGPLLGWLVVAWLLAGAALGELRASDCLAPANPTIQENCRPGNHSSVWDVNADGDPSIQVGEAGNAGQHKTITWASPDHHLTIN